MASGIRKFNAAFTRTIIPILSRINPIPSIDTYLFKAHSNIVFQSTPRSPQRSLSRRFNCYNFESTRIFLHSGYMTCPSQCSRFNHPDYIRRTVQMLKFFIVEPSSLPKYSPRDPVMKYPLPAFLP